MCKGRLGGIALDVFSPEFGFVFAFALVWFVFVRIFSGMM